MSDNTTRIGLPYLAAGQAQKHVTLNDSLRRLDAIVQLSVVSATTTAEPGAPGDGQVWIVPAGKTGTHWAGFADGALGYYRDGAWEQLAPREGWLALVQDTDSLVYYTGSAWSAFPAANILKASGSDIVFGRSSPGAGPAEEIALTAAGRALIDDASASAQRATLGLGSAAVQSTGTSGASVPLLNGANTWSGLQTFSSGGGTVFALGGVPSGSYQDIAFRDSGGQPRFSIGRSDDSGGVLFVNRLDASGAFVDTPFVIPKNGGGDPNIRGFTIFHSGLSLIPAGDNAQTLGDASHRWNAVYAATGAINTSDAREKTPLRGLSAAELRAVRRVMSGVGAFQWLASVASKGADRARLHVGVTAQAVADAFAAEGLEPERYALFCADPAAEPEGEGAPAIRLGVRYDQLFALALAALFSSPAMAA